jgi:hypothetical protein
MKEKHCVPSRSPTVFEIPVPETQQQTLVGLCPFSKNMAEVQ